MSTTTLEIDLTGAHTFRQARARFEKAFLLMKLNQFKWNISTTAGALDVDRTTLGHKMRELGIENPNARARDRINF